MPWLRPFGPMQSRNWRDNLMQPQYAEVVADERVQDAMRRWEEEERTLRGNVEAYFADMHASR